MAKKNPKKNGMQMSHDGLIVLCKHLSPTTIGIGDDMYGWHVTMSLETEMDAKSTREMWAAMGIRKTKFMEDLPLEIDQVALNSKTFIFHDHTATFYVSEEALTEELTEVTLCDFVCIRKSETVYQFNFKLKTPAPEDVLPQLESIALDGAAKARHVLRIGKPLQGAFEMESEEEEHDEETADA